MPQVKFTAGRAAKTPKEITVAAGTAIAGSGGDAVEINVDYTKMTKGEVLQKVDEIKQTIFRGKWPPL